MVTSTSACNTNLSQTSSFENRNNLHDASFSSYLNRAEENFFLLKLTESTKNPSSFISVPQERVYMGKKKVEDGEIGVFGAEKYFKGAMDGENPRICGKGNAKYDHEKDEPIDKSPAKPKTQPATPSVHSESSWNSQSTLLHNVPRNQTRRKANQGSRKHFLANLGCNCYCNGKNSVEVDKGHTSDNSGVVHGKGIAKQPVKTEDLVRPNKSSEEDMHMHCEKFDETGLGSKREDCFSFPILNCKPGDASVKVKLNEGDDDTTRNSLEVFGSPILEKGNKSFSLERKLTMLNWGAVTPRVEGIAIPPNAMYNDTESDASSDLFEIESFSTNPNCYAPSEASIEWSVVTASAADFSMMSDSEEIRTAELATKIPSRMERSGKSTTHGKEMQRRHPGILLGCKSLKSVSVAGDAHRINEKAIPDPRGSHKLDSFKPITKFQTENRLTGFDSRIGQQGFGSHSLSQPHPAHASHLLYIQ